MDSKKLNPVLFYAAFIFIISMLLISCSKDNTKKETTEKKDTTKKTTEGASSPGKDFFYAKSKENNMACGDCHSDGTNTNKPLTKYFSNIQGANKRTSTYHGKFTGEEVVKNAGGATICWESYLRMKTPMTEEQIKILNEYYNSVATADSPTEIKYETIALPTRDKAKLKDEQAKIMNIKGDMGIGLKVFESACAHCHGENSGIKKVPSILEDFDGTEKSIIYNVRLGDGGMPFFHSPQLTDEDIANVSAYILRTNAK